MKDDRNEEISMSSVYDEKDELFSNIHNQNECKIDEMLSTTIYPIWDYRSKENNNSTVLNLSVYKNNYKITKKLIDYCKKNNPDNLKKFINAENDQGIAPIHYASFRGDINIIKLLIENGANYKAKTKKQLTIFHYSAQGNKPNVLMYFYLMLKNDKDNENKFELIKDTDGGGSSPLHWAVYSFAEDYLLYLINLNIFKSDNERQDFINQKDHQGYTPLHLSVTSKTGRITLKLLQNGAYPQVEGKNGETPLQLAISKKQGDIVSILKNSQKCQYCNIKAPIKQEKKNNKNIICAFAFQIITNIILFGSTLPIVVNKIEESYKKYFLFYDYLLLLLIFFIIYIILLNMNPGLRKKRSLEDLEKIINRNADLTKYCYKCYVIKTRSSKHCIICDNCYDKFDHHCFWINKCVAKRNYILFLFFLFETFIYLVSVLFINIYGLINLKEDINNKDICNNYIIFGRFIFERLCENIFNNDYKIVHLIINTLLTLIIFLFLIPEFMLLILHIHVCCTNYREQKKNTRTESISSTSMMNEDDSILFISKSSSKV